MDYTAPPYDEWPSAQPYDAWAHARRHCPVIETPGHEWNPLPSYATTTWDDAVAVLRDSHTFASSINADAMAPFMGEFMVGMDGDEHRRYRNLVAHAFRRSALDRWRADLIEPVVTELLDAIAPTGRADLVAELTARYPVAGDLRHRRRAARRSRAVQRVGRADQLTDPSIPRRDWPPPTRWSSTSRRSWPPVAPTPPATCCRSSSTPRSTASGSPRLASTASCGSCFPPAPRPPTASSATASSRSSPDPTRSSGSATTGR